MRNASSGWEIELAQWLKPFLERLRARRGGRRPGRVMAARLAHPGSVVSGITTKSSQKGPPIALKRAISAD